MVVPAEGVIDGAEDNVVGVEIEEVCVEVV